MGMEAVEILEKIKQEHESGITNNLEKKQQLLSVV